jgi:hypothetical protein
MTICGMDRLLANQGQCHSATFYLLAHYNKLYGFKKNGGHK